MRISLLAASIAASAFLTNVGAAAQPAPQVTVDGLINSLAPPAASGSDPANTGGCDPGFDRGETGECEPLKGATAGFNIGKGSTGSPPAASAPTTASAIPAPARAPVQAPPPSPLPPRAADLLLTFQTNSAEMTAQGIVNAQVFVTALKDPRLSGARFEIEGHTDASGSREYNMVLSQRRADAVKQFLVSQGIRPDALTTTGYGFARLANAGNPLSGENRRVVARRIQ